jgi:hypothetical protein
MSQETAKFYEPRRNFQKKVYYVDYSDSEDEDNMIGLAEWVKGKKIVSCPFGKKEPKKFYFNITRPIRYFICYFNKGKSSSPSFIPYHLQKNSKE